MDGDEFVVAAAAGDGRRRLNGPRIAIGESLASATCAGPGSSVRPDPRESFAARELGARSAIVTPMSFRERPLGFLVVTDRHDGATGRSMKRTSAAAGLRGRARRPRSPPRRTRATRRCGAVSRPPSPSARRWARELHDETLQELAGLRVLLSGARRTATASGWRGRSGATEQITIAIADLRSLIAELRPAALDELGTKPALEAIGRVKSPGLWSSSTSTSRTRTATAARHVPEVESTIYRLVQESLTNVAKHAAATRVAISVSDRDDLVTVVVADDGVGFATEEPRAGFGLTGMRERLAVARGLVHIDSQAGHGTTIHARIPVLRAGAGSAEPAPAYRSS